MANKFLDRLVKEQLYGNLNPSQRKIMKTIQKNGWSGNIKDVNESIYPKMKGSKTKIGEYPINENNEKIYGPFPQDYRVVPGFFTYSYKGPAEFTTNKRPTARELKSFYDVDETNDSVYKPEYKEVLSDYGIDDWNDLVKQRLLSKNDDGSFSATFKGKRTVLPKEKMTRANMDAIEKAVLDERLRGAYDQQPDWYGAVKDYYKNENGEILPWKKNDNGTANLIYRHSRKPVFDSDRYYDRNGIFRSRSELKERIDHNNWYSAPTLYVDENGEEFYYRPDPFKKRLPGPWDKFHPGNEFYKTHNNVKSLHVYGPFDRESYPTISEDEMNEIKRNAYMSSFENPYKEGDSRREAFDFIVNGGYVTGQSGWSWKGKSPGKLEIGNAISRLKKNSKVENGYPKGPSAEHAYWDVNPETGERILRFESYSEGDLW